MSINEKLPVEVLHSVLAKLDYYSLKSFCSTSKENEDICINDSFWRFKFNYDFGFIPKEKSSTVTKSRRLIVSQDHCQYEEVYINYSDISIFRLAETIVDKYFLGNLKYVKKIFNQ